MLHELRAAMASHNTGGQLHYWRTPHGSKVDFIWTRAKRSVGIEVKASERWRSEFGAPPKGLVEAGVQTGFGVYAWRAGGCGSMSFHPVQAFAEMSFPAADQGW